MRVEVDRADLAHHEVEMELERSLEEAVLVWLATTWGMGSIRRHP